MIFLKNLTEKNMRLWKINCKLTDIKSILSKNLSEINNSSKFVELPDLNYLECNVFYKTRCAKNGFVRIRIC